jgi:hypothetical protein
MSNAALATALPGWLLRLRAGLAGALPGGGVGRHARLLQSLPLGPGSRLLVVEFGGRKLLIGQARTGLVRLGEADAGDVLP